MHTNWYPQRDLPSTPQQPLEVQQQHCSRTSNLLKSYAICLTNLWKGSFRIKSLVLFWYLWISEDPLFLDRNGEASWSSSRRRWLPYSFGSQVLPWWLSSSGFSCCLLCSCHCFRSSSLERESSREKLCVNGDCVIGWEMCIYGERLE